MVYKLRAHHAKDLPKLLKVHPVKMFISNFIRYGWKEAWFRHRLLKQMRNDKYAKVEVVNGREDIICRQCRHFRYCNTNFNSYRTKRMQLYEKYLLNGKLHRPYLADHNIILSGSLGSDLTSQPTPLSSTVPPSSLE